jgi:hypothetical protein
MATTTSGRIEWEDPPERAVGTYAALFDELRASPGEWAVFKRGLRHPGGIVGHLRNGDYKGIKGGELEVRSHRGPNGLTTIYVRIPSSRRRRSTGEP